MCSEGFEIHKEKQTSLGIWCNSFVLKLDIKATEPELQNFPPFFSKHFHQSRVY